MIQVNDPHILVVEDNLALGKLISFTLERAGFRVTRAISGTEGWRLAQSGTFSMVVTDYQMPGLTGQELAGRLRTLPQYRETPIMLLTAKRFELNAQSLRDEVGIVHVFPKPFSPLELVTAVEEQLAARS
jgi:two-component system, chemotaxis family, chemotaxis protein CheY